jgi:hypothetical protein
VLSFLIYSQIILTVAISFLAREKEI